MPTYLSNLYAYPTVTGSGEYKTFKQVFAATIPSPTALVLNDIIKLAPIPLNHKVVNWALDFPAVDTSTGVVARLGDYANSNAIYATGLVLGRSSAGGFVVYGGTGTVAGTIGSQKAVYTVKNALREKMSSADDFFLTISTAPTTAITTARIFYGWVEFEPDTMADTQ